MQTKAESTEATHLVFSKRSCERANEIRSSPRDFNRSSQGEQHLCLYRKEVYPEIKDRNRARFDKLSIRLIRSREEGQSVVSNGESSYVVDPGYSMF